MLIVDQVYFKVPTDWELMFPAVATMQAYIRDYEAKMKAALPDGKNSYQLAWNTDLGPTAWGMLRKVGLQVVCPPRQLTKPDMIVDMSENAINRFCDSGKHVCQVCGVLSGVGNIMPLPTIRHILPKIGTSWAIIDADIGQALGLEDLCIQVQDLLNVEDQQWSGVIGRASWATYLAASMLLPVVEITPHGRPDNWLSKWTNKLYRAVRANADGTYDQALIRTAMQSIEEALPHVQFKQPEQAISES